VQPDLAVVIAQLQQDGEALPWPERRALVKAVAEQISRVGATETSLSLLLLLAEDPKWEVRKDVADCLLLVPEDEFPRLAAKLSEDPNAFVQKSAERALDRRRRGQESAQRKRRGLDQVEDQYASIERAHGSVAAGKALQMAERLYDVLVGATVHDMRNILGPLKSGVSTLLSHLGDNRFDAAQFEKHLTKMDHQTEMLERLLEDMRTYSQATPSDRHRERLADVVQEAHAMVLDAFRATNRDASEVCIKIDVPENLTLEVSRHQIVRAVSNVLKNAYEAFADDPQTFRSGVVTLSARPVDGERVEIVVSDNGMGLSGDELAEVRRFVPGGTSKKTYGTGFGLPIAKRKVEDHGGLLGVESEVEKGTVVTITLPVEAAGDSG